MSENRLETETNSTVTADWCSFCSPELARFNKAFVKRNGKGFAHVVVLKAANEDEIDYCYEKERAYFNANGWECAFVDYGAAEKQPNMLIFRADERADEVFNTFDVTGVNSLNLNEVIEMIGFDDLTSEFLEQIKPECINYFTSKVKELGTDRFVNEIVMDHYNKTDNDSMTDDDLVKMFGTTDVMKAKSDTGILPGVANYKEPEKTIPKPETSKQKPDIKPAPYDNNSIHSHPIASSSVVTKSGKFRPLPSKQGVKPTIAAKPAISIETSVSEDKPEQKAEPKEKVTTPVRNETKPAQIEVPIETETPEPETTETAEMATETSETIESSKSESEDNGMPDVPVPVQVKKITFQSKESLSEDDKKANADLLHKIRSKYEGVLQYIRDLHSPQFTIFINMLSEALDNNKYTKQWCPVYLDITDDITTELYAKLYELDQITAEFNKKLIHQIMHIGCPFCANEWDEDVTFKNAGVHYTRCPKCNNERPFEKED